MPPTTDGPWRLMTPEGRWRTVVANELSAFAVEIDDELHNVMVLVHRRQGNLKAGKVKQHAKHYQLDTSVVWIRRTGTGEKVPVVGGDAKFFHRALCLTSQVRLLCLMLPRPLPVLDPSHPCLIAPMRDPTRARSHRWQ